MSSEIGAPVPRSPALMNQPPLPPSALETSSTGSSTSTTPAAPAGIHSGMASYSLEQSYLHQNGREDLSVGLPRYQHHPSPVCDRKDFVLNFNGISSFHPSASSSYYHHHHHHHHQTVCQDIKPCVM